MESGRLPLIGRKTKVRFPQWGSIILPAKVDTGALFSTIHAEAIREKKGQVVPTLFFHIHPSPGDAAEPHPILCEVTKYRKVRIRSTSGDLESRYCVTAIIEMDGKMYETECTLADRSKMRVPVLLGRKFLRGNFLVDVTRTFSEHG